MKKYYFIIAAAFIITSSTSCEKNYTCTCVYPGSSVGTTKTTFKAKSKGTAQTTCDKQNVAANVSGGSCAL